MSYESSVKRCNEMLALAKSGAIIWWRRGGFHEEPFRGVEPKWHVLTGRLSHHNTPEMLPLEDPVWLALCGYKKGFDERIFEVFPRLTKRAPKKDTRCRKCAAELPDHLEQLAEQSDKQVEAVQPAG
jgi:hypothetical protein